MAYSTTELMAVLASLASDKASLRVMYPSRSGFEGSSVGVSSLVVVRTSARGSGRRRAGGCTTAVMEASCHFGLPQRRGWRHSAWDGGVAAEMAGQG
jgi:hypothetical protein